MKSLTKSRKNRNRIKDGYTPVKIVVSIVFALYALSLLACLFWAFLMSFKGRFEYMLDPVSLPKEWIFSNYSSAFRELSSGQNNMFVMLLNSLWYAGGSTVIPISVCTLTAYVCAKYRFFLGKTVYWLCIGTMIIPIVGNLPSQFLLAKVLHTYDSPLTLITGLGGISFTTLLLYSFFKSIDHGFAEAAYIDGASHFQIFYKIMLPMALPPIGALALTSFTALWNDSEGPLVFLPSYPTLASGLYVYQVEAERTLNNPVLYAGLLMTALPIVVLWILFNKHLLSLQFGGGLKG
ncbi:sugar ABC transporter permease [Clostridia bacterium]|nr:sugar ABC transporter permease [Clostridia bacterium]